MESADLLKYLGERIKAIRKESKISQERLAELADLNLSYMSEIERGRANVSLCIVNSIANALKLSLTELLAGGLQVDGRDDLLLLIQQVQTLDARQQKVFIKTAHGILAGIREV